MSHVTCNLSCIRCHMSNVTDKVFKLIGQGSIINGAYPVQLKCKGKFSLENEAPCPHITQLFSFSSRICQKCQLGKKYCISAQCPYTFQNVLKYIFKKHSQRPTIFFQDLALGVLRPSKPMVGYFPNIFLVLLILLLRQRWELSKKNLLHLNFHQVFSEKKKEKLIYSDRAIFHYKNQVITALAGQQQWVETIVNCKDKTKL